MPSLKETIFAALENKKDVDMIHDIKEMLNQLHCTQIDLVNPRVIIDTMGIVCLLDGWLSLTGDEYLLCEDTDEFFSRLGAEFDNENNISFPEGFSGAETIDHIQTVYLS